MADLTRMEELVVKRLEGKLKHKEKKELKVLARASEENRQFIDRWSPGTIRKMRQAAKGIDHDRIDRLTKAKVQHIPGVLDWITETGKERRLLPYTIAAACALLIVGRSLWFSHRPQTDKSAAGSTVTPTLYWRSSSDAGPGTTFADSIVLGDIREGRSYPVGKVQISRIRNLVFISPWRDSATAADAALAYQLVSGEQDIKVIFQDSSLKTRLWPNSSLAFTISPPGTPLKERLIACEGQALFDVGHNCEIPTRVKTPKGQVAVLGTLFMVRDYKQEDTGEVLCYNGKVAIDYSDKPATILVGSQRATVRPGRAIQVSNRDFPQVEWESPALPFDFSNLDLDSSMHEIAEWYGIPQVCFGKGVNKKMPGTVLTGPISRYIPLPQLLSILNRKDLHFSIFKQTIMVEGPTDTTASRR